MASKDDELLKRLLAIFKVEAQEHVEAIASGLVELEQASTRETRAGVLDRTFRSAHSLKGAARAVNVTEVESLCQSLEGVFASMKRGDLSPSSELFDLLHRIVDSLGTLLEFVEGRAPASTRSNVSDLLHSLQSALKGEAAGKTQEPVLLPAPPPDAPPLPAAEVAPPPVEEKRGAVDTVRVSTIKLDAVLRMAEEMLAIKQASTQQAIRLRQASRAPLEWKKKWARLRPDVRTLERALAGKSGPNAAFAGDPQLERMVEFLEWNRDFVESLESDLADLNQTTARDQRAVGAMVDNLLDEMKKIVMQPFSTLLDIVPRVVRELARDLGKEIDLSIQGAEIEIDRRILEELKDPLIHLVRNSVDHGIELPAERTQRGKAGRGTISLIVSARNGSNVELLLTDDGGGIDVGKVKGAARKLRLFSPEKAESLDDKETLPLIFQSGLSTSPIITDLSGRGLGLAIVKEKVEKLNGTLSVESQPGQGTSFRIVLPLTLARFHGVTVRAGGQLFVLPTSHVERVIRVRKEEIKTVENRETLSLKDQAVALARLSSVLDLAEPAVAVEAPAVLPAVVLNAGNQRIAFIVDEVLHEQEVLVKTLGKHLVHVKNIAGATVQGNGKVVPILNVPELIKSAVRKSESGAHAPKIDQDDAPARKKSVLVAEDSITSRTLLKNILETSGYRVETSVDGVDALTKLRSGQFDLVVSDVDMPRLNGFGLTAKIRADKRYADLPVILVTSLDSREDREHGIDVGATAYIVKSSFDQSNLLAVIRRSL